MCKKNKRVRLSTLIGVFEAYLLSSFQFVSYGQPVEAYAHKDSLVIDSTALNVKIKDLSEVVVRGRKWAKISRYSALSMPLSTLDLQTTPMALGDILGGLQVVPSVQGNDADARFGVIIDADGHSIVLEVGIDGSRLVKDIVRDIQETVIRAVSEARGDEDETVVRVRVQSLLM